MNIINRIRKKALTDEELVAARAQDAAHAQPEDPKAVETRLQAVADEAIPLVDDTKALAHNLQVIKNQFGSRGYYIEGKDVTAVEQQINIQTRDGVVQLKVTQPPA